MGLDHRYRELDRLTGLAFGEAIGLGHGYVAPEHFLLAIVRPDHASIAARALRTSGATYEVLHREVTKAFAESKPAVPRPDYPGGVGTSPVSHELLGCALGVAIGLGLEDPAAEHVLVAYLWRSDHEWLFDQVGTSRQVVYEHLGDLGFATPRPTLPPAAVPAGSRQRAYLPLERLDEVVAQLQALLPKGTSWGWNIADESQAYVSAEGDFDLDEVVRRALAGTS
jgi:hypothetical protein